jgi:hypothetical protein
MKELIEKMIWLLEEYKDKCCDNCKPNEYEIIYKRYDCETMKPYDDYPWCSLWIYKIVAPLNWLQNGDEWYCAAIPSRDWLTILKCKKHYNEWHIEILFHFTKDDLKEWSKDL